MDTLVSAPFYRSNKFKVTVRPTGVVVDENEGRMVSSEPSPKTFNDPSPKTFNEASPKTFNNEASPGLMVRGVAVMGSWFGHEGVKPGVAAPLNRRLQICIARALFLKPATPSSKPSIINPKPRNPSLELDSIVHALRRCPLPRPGPPRLHSRRGKWHPRLYPPPPLGAPQLDHHDGGA